MWDMSSCRVVLRLRSDVFLSHSPSHLLRQDHSLNQKLTDWLGSGSPPSNLGVTHTDNDVIGEDLDSGPRVSMAMGYQGNHIPCLSI